MNGLANGVGLMSSPDGRTTLAYIVKCALPAGRSISKKDQNNANYTFAGQIGVAPEWETDACETDCQERVTACVLAHVNTTGQHIQLWLDSDVPAIGWGRSTDYPYQEGSFFGNIFQDQPKAYYCDGKDFDQGTVLGRLGANQNGAPYTNPFGNGAYCKDRCTAADSPYNNDGYKACNGYNHVVTVWRNFDPNIDYKVCNRRTNKCLDVEYLSKDNGAHVQQWDYWGGANQKWRIKQVAPGRYNFMSVNSGKLMDIFGASTNNGAQLVQWAANGGSNQQWSFTPTGNGYYKFGPASKASASLEVPNGTSSSGAYVQQWDYFGGDYQMWSVLPAN